MSVDRNQVRSLTESGNSAAFAFGLLVAVIGLLLAFVGAVAKGVALGMSASRALCS